MNPDDVSILVIRIGVSLIYLYAAYQNTRFFKTYTVPETALLFRGTGLDTNQGLVRCAAIVGLVMMYVGALMLGTGAVARVGAGILALFTAMGFVIHRHRWLDAQKTAKELGEGVGAPMAWSAYSGHFSSALKNLSLIAICVAVSIGGPGAYSLFPVWP